MQWVSQNRVEQLKRNVFSTFTVSSNEVNLRRDHREKQVPAPEEREHFFVDNVDE